MFLERWMNIVTVNLITNFLIFLIMARVTINISAVLKDLNNGLTRPEISSKYSISLTDVKSMFEHPLLKGKKPRKPKGFILVDDITSAAELDSSQIPESASEPDSNETAIEVAEAIPIDNETQKALEEASVRAEEKAKDARMMDTLAAKLEETISEPVAKKPPRPSKPSATITPLV